MFVAESGDGRWGRAATCSFEMYLPRFESAADMFQGICDTIAVGSFGTV